MRDALGLDSVQKCVRECDKENDGSCVRSNQLIGACYACRYIKCLNASTTNCTKEGRGFFTLHWVQAW